MTVNDNLMRSLWTHSRKHPPYPLDVHMIKLNKQLETGLRLYSTKHLK